MDHDFTKDYQDAVQTVRKRRRKKSTSIGRKFKGAAKSRLRLQEANKLLSRDIPNPFLHMNIEELKQHAISLCYRQIKEQMGKGMSYTESRGGAVRDVQCNKKNVAKKSWQLYLSQHPFQIYRTKLFLGLSEFPPIHQSIYVTY